MSYGIELTPSVRRRYAAMNESDRIFIGNQLLDLAKSPATLGRSLPSPPHVPNTQGCVRKLSTEYGYRVGTIHFKYSQDETKLVITAISAHDVVSGE